MEIDWTPMREVMNHLALKLVIGLVIMFVFGYVAGKICSLIKLPQPIINLAAMIGVLYGIWFWAKTFL